MNLVSRDGEGLSYGRVTLSQSDGRSDGGFLSGKVGDWTILSLVWLEFCVTVLLLSVEN